MLIYQQQLQQQQKQQQQQPFNSSLSRPTWVNRHQKKQPSTPTLTYPDHQLSFISFLPLLQSIASSLFNLCAWQSFCTTSLQSPGPLWSTYWSGAHHFTLHRFLHPIIVFFSQHMPYHRNLFCCSIDIMPSIPSLSLNFLLGTLSFTLTPHIHMTILISARWSATSFSFLTGQVSLHYNILLRTQAIWILASTAASASPSTLNMSPKQQNSPLTLDLHWHQYLQSVAKKYPSPRFLEFSRQWLRISLWNFADLFNTSQM